jgi:ribosomal protein S18 acetylase RimI-like enzyme
MDAEACTIREAGNADLPRLAQLYRMFLEETLWSLPDVRRNPRLDVDRLLAGCLHGEHSAVLAAELKGEVVGFVCVEFRPPGDRPLGLLASVREFFARRRAKPAMLSDAYGYLVHLFVEARARRKAIASALVLASRDWVKLRGGHALELNVLAENDPARALYRKLGMSEFLVHYRMEF